MAHEKEAPKKPARQITRFDELEPVQIFVEIPQADGEWISLPVRPLGVRQWEQVGRTIPVPQPPIMGADDQKRPLYDWNDTTYRQAVTDANTRRTYARLFAFIGIEVPGDTLDAKITALEARLHAGEIQALAEAMERLFKGEEAKIVSTAATFHAEGPDGTADDGAAGAADAGRAVQPA